MTEQKKTEKKNIYFKQIVAKRLDRILEALDALGNCSTPATYAYSSQDLSPIFEAITKKLFGVRQRLVTHSPYNGVPFRLQPPNLVELDSHTINRQKLVSMAEATARIETNTANFVSLASVQEKYEIQFRGELCWNCPVCHDEYSGCILLPVQEGILYFPYKAVSSTTYAQFDLQRVGLLTKQQAQALSNALWDTYLHLFGLLSDIQAFGLVQGDSAEEDSHE